MPYNSLPVDITHLPSCFTRLPVRIHIDKEEIQQFTIDFTHANKHESLKAHKHALYRFALTGSDANFYSLCFPEADVEKLKLVVEFVELTWTHDDVAEEEPYHVAGAESERLRRAMYEEYDNEPTGSDEYGLRIRRFRDIRNRMQGIDPVGWVEVRDATEEWFHIEKRLEEFASVEAYLDVRKIHSGNKYMTALIRWAMGLHLNESELAIVEPTTDCVGIFLSLLNDYISWKRERDQPTDRIMNSVYVAMKNYNVDEEVAYDIIRGMLVKQEIKFLEMSEALRGRKGLSSGVRMYLQNLEYYAGGMFYWHILAPRYSKPQSFDPERED